MDDSSLGAFVGLLIGVAIGILSGVLLTDAKWSEATGAESTFEFKACKEQFSIPSCKNKKVVFVEDD
jgi:gas vesicle protein